MYDVILSGAGFATFIWLSLAMGTSVFRNLREGKEGTPLIILTILFAICIVVTVAYGAHFVIEFIQEFHPNG